MRYETRYWRYGLAMTDDLFDPVSIDDVRDRIIVPVVSSLFTKQEVDEITLSMRRSIHYIDDDIGEADGFYVTTSPPRVGEDRVQELWVRVVAIGMVWEAPIWSELDPEPTEEQIAARFAESLERWVNEDVLRGVGRFADYELKPRSATPP
jgi:hypothetical protein